MPPLAVKELKHPTGNKRSRTNLEGTQDQTTAASSETILANSGRESWDTTRNPSTPQTNHEADNTGLRKQHSNSQSKPMSKDQIITLSPLPALKRQRIDASNMANSDTDEDNDEVHEPFKERVRRHELHADRKQAAVITAEKSYPGHEQGTDLDNDEINMFDLHEEFDQEDDDYTTLDDNKKHEEGPSTKRSHRHSSSDTSLISRSAKIPALPKQQQSKPNQDQVEKTIMSEDSVSSNDDAWQARVDELRQYKEKFGNCLVPKKSRTHPQLGIWVMNQRAQYKLLQERKPSTMTPERMEALESVGFVWSMCDHVDWEDRLEELKEYKREHGDCLVPNKYPLNPQLGTWVNKQRTQYKLMCDGRPSSMTKERVKALEKLGFVWSKRDLVDWFDRLDELKAYKEKYGDCLVPNKFAPNPQLGTWVMHQRAQYRKLREGKNSPMTEERVKSLEEIGFVWAISNADTDWTKRVDDLRRYREKHGNCLVPNKYTENPKLGAWVGKQRKQFKMFQEGKPSNMTMDRIKILEDLGFVWSLRSLVDWDARLEELKEYQSRHGNCLVPQQYPENPQLGTWVSNQRKQYRLMKEDKPSPMTPERVKKLEELGFVWSIFSHDSHWEAKFEELREFKEIHGNCAVPVDYEPNPNLGVWVKYQRSQYRMLQDRRPSTMTPERIELLESLGFTWEMDEEDEAEYSSEIPSATIDPSFLQAVHPSVNSHVEHPDQIHSGSSMIPFASSTASRVRTPGYPPRMGTHRSPSGVLIDHAPRRDVERPQTQYVSTRGRNPLLDQSPWARHWQRQRTSKTPNSTRRNPNQPLGTSEDHGMDEWDPLPHFPEPLGDNEMDISTPAGEVGDNISLQSLSPEPADWDELFDPISYEGGQGASALEAGAISSAPAGVPARRPLPGDPYAIGGPGAAYYAAGPPVGRPAPPPPGAYIVYYEVATPATPTHAVVSPQNQNHDFHGHHDQHLYWSPGTMSAYASGQGHLHHGPHHPLHYPAPRGHPPILQAYSGGSLGSSSAGSAGHHPGTTPPRRSHGVPPSNYTHARASPGSHPPQASPIVYQMRGNEEHNSYIPHPSSEEDPGDQAQLRNEVQQAPGAPPQERPREAYFRSSPPTVPARPPLLARTPSQVRSRLEGLQRTNSGYVSDDASQEEHVHGRPHPYNYSYSQGPLPPAPSHGPPVAHALGRPLLGPQPLPPHAAAHGNISRQSPYSQMSPTTERGMPVSRHRSPYHNSPMDTRQGPPPPPGNYGRGSPYRPSAGQPTASGASRGSPYTQTPNTSADQKLPAVPGTLGTPDKPDKPDKPGMNVLTGASQSGLSAPPSKTTRRW